LNKQLKQKVLESLSAVLPVTAIVLLLSVSIVSMDIATLALFLIGSLLLILGMGLFSLGAELAMIPLGEKAGKQLISFNKVPFIMLCCFLIGAFITIAEPNVQVLAEKTPSINNWVLILSVSFGIGIFLVFSLIRSIFDIALYKFLFVAYGIVFVLCYLVPEAFVVLAFDSGGVATGPITIPFIMALGIGLSRIGKRFGKGEGDGFGMIALSAVGPIIAILVLGLIYGDSTKEYVPKEIITPPDSKELGMQFINELPKYMYDVMMALVPIVVFFIIFQIFFFKLRKRQLIKIIVGIIYTFFGLVLFLTGANVGFMPAGTYIGSELAKLDHNIVIVPISMIIGYFIIRAEPAVPVLNQQVEETTNGTISKSTMMNGISIGMALSVGLSVLRILYDIPAIWFILSGYLIALLLSFVVPKKFTSIAFDSGCVASGVMASTFLLPFTIGACEAVSGDVLTNAFGIIGMVTMTPIIIIQFIGVIYRIKTRKHDKIHKHHFHIHEHKATETALGNEIEIIQFDSEVEKE